MCKLKAELLTCGDINTDYLTESSSNNNNNNNNNNKKASLLTTHNLSHTVNFVTTIQNNSSTAIDNILEDNKYIIYFPYQMAYQITMLRFSKLKIYMQQHNRQ
jgi:hypothetical protein